MTQDVTARVRELLKRSETAEELNCSVRTIDAHIRTGNLAAVRLGRLVRVHRDEINRVKREGLPSLVV